jgi:methionyl-tRNA formyltransferase
MMIGVFAAAASAATPRLRAGLPRVVCTASSRAPKRVVFLGTPPVAARSLELLLAKSRSGGADFEVAAVVSQPPSRSGRKMKLTPSPVASLAEAEGLRLLTPPSAKDEGFLQELAALRPDLCVTAAYGCFLPQRFLDIPERGTLNIHPSLLPLYRGAAPVQRCLEAGDAVTGVSVAFTVLAMDSGPILRQVCIRCIPPLPPRCTSAAPPLHLGAPSAGRCAGRSAATSSSLSCCTSFSSWARSSWYDGGR